MEFIEQLYHADHGGIRVGDLTLYCCGRRTDAPRHRFGPAARDHYWLIYLREGSGWFEMSGIRHRLEKSMLITAFPGRRIHYYADADSVWSISWLSLDAVGFEEYLPLMGIREDSPIVRVESPGAIENVFDSLLDEVPRETARSKLACVGLVYKLLSLVTESGDAQQRDYIDEAIFYMTVNHERALEITEIAAAVGLDRSYFSRLFRKKTGRSPTDWLLDYRLAKAERLLLETGMSIREIALSVGFDDALYFTRRFTERCGEPPTAWRKRQNFTAGG